MKSTAEEKKNEKRGMIISGSVHALMLILFLLLAAWREPNPPNPGIPGVELALGFEDAGSGNNPSETTSPEPQQEEAKPEKAASEPTPEPTPEPEPETTPEPVVTSQVESPHVVKEEKPAPKPKETPKPKVESKPKTEEATKETKEGGQSVAQENMMPSGGGKGDGSKPGNAGKPEGKVDGNNLYGTPGGGGGGGGASLAIDGWRWDSVPDKKDDSSEKGSVTFDIQVDDQGYIKSVKVFKNNGLSHSVVQFYERQVRELTFSRTNSLNAPTVTTGRITFQISSR